ncbi:bifunctional 4-hydroxy-2-oxoglutarate aldolase/2-dehydro-3-deoxy-phosphogluconate aldolase [Candidatus Omnitrophota bacterium]
MDVAQFIKLPIMGIIRGVSHDAIAPLTESVISSGLKTIEITMNTPDAAQLLRQMVKTASGRLTIGVGTVLSVDDVKKALDSGATFIVSPTLVPEVVEYCAKHTIAVFPGALTPQEIYNCWSAGATMVKVFPAKFFGPSYIKEVKGPFNDIKLLVCGGVNVNTIEQFFLSGASAVAFGASIFKKEWLSDKQFSLIEQHIKSLIEKIKPLHLAN